MPTPIPLFICFDLYCCDIRQLRWLGLILAGCLLLSYEATAQQTQTMKEINVTSTRVAKEPLIERETLKWNERPTSDAADFLKQKAGFSAAKIGGTSGTVFLRGMGGPRLGIVVNDHLEEAGANHGTDPGTSYIQPDGHDHVTVIKGPNTVLYGSTMGGLVKFDETVKRFDKPSLRGRVVGGIGSYGRRDYTVDGTIGTPLIQLRGLVSHAAGDNYKDGSGRAFFSFFERQSRKLVAILTPTDNITAEFSAENGDSQVAFPAYSLMGDGIHFKREILGARFTAKKVSETLKLKKLEMQFFDRNLDHQMDNFTLRPVIPTVIIPGVAFSTSRRTLFQKFRGRSARVVATFDPFPATEVVFGYEHKDDKFIGNNTNDATTCIFGNCINQTVQTPFYNLATVNNALFAEVSHFLDQINTSVKFGLRRDYYHTRAGDLQTFLGTRLPTAFQDRDDVVNNLFVRAEYDLAPIGGTAFVALANGERAASNLERASFDGFNLKKEINREINTGFSWNQPVFQGSVTFFASHINNYILINQGTRSENVDVNRMGAEADAAFQITPKWKLFGSLAWIRAQNLTGHGQGSVPLAQTPPLDARLALAYQYKTFSINFGGRFVAKQDRIDPGSGNSLGIDNADATPGFSTASLSLSWRPWKQTQLSMGVDNILDLTYTEHLSRRVGDQPPGFVSNSGRVNEPGRAFWMRVVLSTL